MNEQDLHRQVTDYLRLQHREALFRTDMGGVRLSFSQARSAKRVQHGRAFPDLGIYEARHDYHGLFIELKREGTKLFLKDGVTMVANPHYHEQAEVLRELNRRGYHAVFACGFDECKSIIDEYLS